MNDLISRQAAIDAIRASTSKYTGFMEMEMYTDDDAVEAIEGLPSAHKPTDEWCTTCKEYDQEKKCCPKFNRVIRNAMPEIVYCKECKYNINNPVPFYDDDPIMTYAWCNTECFDENGFCSCGKRIEE